MWHANKPNWGSAVKGAACYGALGFACVAAVPSSVAAETNGANPFVSPAVPSMNLYGSPGLIDMPTAEMAPDATLSTTFSHFGGTTRSTLTFQILPRLSGSFRYSAVNGLVILPSYPGDSTYFDRSFDLRYQVLTEGKFRPSVTVGLQDFIGTGVYGGEYIVASKAITPSLRLTGGLGWGRLGSNGAIGTSGNRPTGLIGEGGIPTYDRWFRGDFAPFGGIAWSPTDKLTFSVEYSSDAYSEESGRSGMFERASPWNFGVDYKFRSGTQLSLFALYGSEIGAMVSLPTNPKYATFPGSRDLAPLPVKRRAAADIRDLGWTDDDATIANVKTRLKTSLGKAGLVYEGLSLSGTTATLRLRNPKYGQEPQAIGRAARSMSRILPGSVETFIIIPMVNGMAVSATTLKRRDLENLENAPARDLLARTQFSDAYGMAPDAESGLYPDLIWSFSPYLSLSVFDPDNPVRVDVGLRAQADYTFAPNWVLSGAVTKKLAGNLDSVTRQAISALPRVRTDRANYSREGDPAIEHLTLSTFGRPRQNIYSRLTVGYLESMYAGVSGELLWKPIDSRLAFGAEVNYVQKRDFDQLFGLQDYDTVTGHLSAYYDFGNGFHGQVDVGRYLAGDYGATISLDREFKNGWRVGAYATFTDVPFEDFGEGSFDKGIRISVPLAASSGTSKRGANPITIQSLTRDGGARVDIRDRLYSRIRDYHQEDLSNEWGRVWR